MKILQIIIAADLELSAARVPASHLLLYLVPATPPRAASSFRRRCVNALWPYETYQYANFMIDDYTSTKWEFMILPVID